MTAHFIAGAKAASVALAVNSGEVIAQSQFARFADAQVRELDLPDIEDETELDSLDSFVGSIKEFIDDLPIIGDWFAFGPPTNGEATGTIEIENTGAVPFRPTFELGYSLRNDRGKFRSAFEAEVEGKREIIQPDDGPQTYDITYQVPTDKGFLSGELDVSLGMSPEAIAPVKDAVIPVSICELDYNAVEADSATDKFTVADEATIETVEEGLVTESNVKTTTVSPEASLNQVTVELDFEGYTSDLLLYDESGNRVGYDNESGTEVNEIPGATYSGRDTGETNNEWVTLPPTGETYTVEVRAPSLTGQMSAEPADSTYAEDSSRGTKVRPSDALTSEFEVYKLEEPELPAELATTPSTLTAVTDGEPESITFSVVVEEANGDQAIEDVSLAATPLEHEGSTELIPDEDITFSDQDFDVANSRLVKVTVELPDEPTLGNYLGQIEVAGGNVESVTVDTRLEIRPPPLPGQESPPGDLDGDGRFEDIDGDGEFDIFDVQALFEGLNSDPVQNNPAAFNFNDDDNPEEEGVTIFDVQGLFELLD